MAQRASKAMPSTCRPSPTRRRHEPSLLLCHYCDFLPPNGQRISGERRADGDERVRCMRVLGAGLPLEL